MGGVEGYSTSPAQMFHPHLNDDREIAVQRSATPGHRVQKWGTRTSAQPRQPLERMNLKRVERNVGLRRDPLGLGIGVEIG